jgi:urease beta subunit
MALAPGAPRRTVLLRNTGHRDVWISSHFPLDQVNPAVEIRFADDAKAPTVPAAEFDLDGGVTGWRLDLPAGEALQLRPGEDRMAQAVSAGSLAAHRRWASAEYSITSAESRCALLAVIRCGRGASH